MIDQNRVQQLNSYSYTSGAIVYWMSRDQRVKDNWALLYASELAQKYNQPLVVVFCLRKTFPYATERLVNFMLDGLKEVEESLQERKIPFYFLLGEPEQEILSFSKKHAIGAVISDFSPLLYNRKWKELLAKELTIPLYEVDAHNIVPCFKASPKQEFAAYTFRPKIHCVLGQYLTEFPTVLISPVSFNEKVVPIDWEKIYSQIEVDKTVKKVNWILPGEKKAAEKLVNFIRNVLPRYTEWRNDPTAFALSELSPYIHFGHIAAQRIALEVREKEEYRSSVDAFLEELIVRKELADNFCFYNHNYLSFKGFPAWPQKTLLHHAEDKREYIYTKHELEKAKTHDILWNAAQTEMIKRGKMHGYLRMYWAKKILEWSPSVSEALSTAQQLNDTYFLDGRDPNGYTGIAWSMGGVHDRAWFDREIFGKIRYMSYNSTRKKFDTTKYISWVNSL